MPGPGLPGPGAPGPGVTPGPGMPTDSPVLNALRAVARHFLPIAIGNLAGKLVRDGSGAWVDAGASMFTDTLLGESELEGLSGEDREFEIARRYVRLAIDALERALQAPARVPTPIAARVAVTEAARTHAPGLVPVVPRLLSAPPERGSNGHEPGGRWTRRGSSIVVEPG
jgi:hypothetical protein